MRLIPNFKAHCMCVIIATSTLCTNAAADSIEIVLDAALDQSSMQAAGNAALSIARSAGTDHSIGLVVFDEVFQRSTDRLPADDVQAQRISEVLASITPVKFSNIAVGIEKGISELDSDGGVLLVFGSSAIQLADTEAASKYRDWLQFVLLPDAAEKSIGIILASPQSAQANALDSIILEYPENSVISYTDTADVVDKLSTLLPIQLIGNTQIAQVSPTDSPAAILDVSENVSQDVSQNVSQEVGLDADLAAVTLPASTAVSAESEQQGWVSLIDYILLAIGTLVFIAIAVTVFLVRRMQTNKGTQKVRRKGFRKFRTPADDIAPATPPTPSRYLAPKQDLAAILTTRAADAELSPTVVRPQSYASQSATDADELEDTIVTESWPIEDEIQFDIDNTAPREPNVSDDVVQEAELNTTVRQKAISSDDTTVLNEEGAVDELEELKNLTQQKHLSQV